MIDFMCNAVARASFEQLAKAQGWLTPAGEPAGDVHFDPTPGSPEYVRGLPIHPPKQPPTGVGPPAFVQGYHFNIRVEGELEQEQIEGLPQLDEEGNTLPLRLRTKFGLMMDDLGVPWTGANGVTTGCTHAGVTFVDPESVATPQRVWQ